jgi:hypothetical protein
MASYVQVGKELRIAAVREQVYMAVISTFTCVCGVQKKTSNHWVLAKAAPSGIRFMPWDWEMAKREDITVLCGEGCAAALLSRSLSEWKQLGSAVEHELATP